jgi:hypothetical protein
MNNERVWKIFKSKHIPETRFILKKFSGVDKTLVVWWRMVWPIGLDLFFDLKDGPLEGGLNLLVVVADGRSYQQFELMI